MLQGYQPLFHDLFLRSYARVLDDLHRNSTIHEANLEYRLHQHDQEAYKYLWTIQHQKLFDLECQWRAELLTVPEARLTANFEDWHDYIEDCRVIPPISPEEVELLDQFLAQLSDPEALVLGNPAGSFWLHRRYPHMQDDDEEELSEWTQFWDEHRGTAYLRQLPDVRGGKEFRYERAVRDEKRRANPSPPPAPPDPRPSVPTYGPGFDTLVRDLLRRFEPAILLRQFDIRQQLEAHNAANAATDDDIDLPLALERLRNAGPLLVSIQAHPDWRLAVIEAANRHYLDQLRAALPRVYEHYVQRESLGIGHAPAQEHHYGNPGENFEDLQETIREGRRLLGEPDDLDF